MTSKEAVERIENDKTLQFHTETKFGICPGDYYKKELETIKKDLEEYEIAKNLIRELRIILYADDEECKTNFDMIRKSQLKILQYLEDKAKRVIIEKLVKEGVK